MNADTKAILSLVWQTKDLGLWLAMRRHFREHRVWPVMDLGSLPVWLDAWQATRHRVAEMRSKWKGQTVVCVGNGPSINQTELGHLNGRVVIGTNRAYKTLDRYQPASFQLLVQDNYRLNEIADDLQGERYPIHVGTCLFGDEWLPPSLIKSEQSNASVYLPPIKWLVDDDQIRPEADFSVGFSNNPARRAYYGQSVIFSAIQFAAFAGARRIVCIGIDMDYTQSTNFLPNVKMHWLDFDYDTHCRPMFEHLEKVLRRRGVEFINATPGGKVEAMPRMTLADAMQRA